MNSKRLAYFIGSVTLSLGVAFLIGHSTGALPLSRGVVEGHGATENQQAVGVTRSQNKLHAPGPPVSPLLAPQAASSTTPAPTPISPPDIEEVIRMIEEAETTEQKIEALETLSTSEKKAEVIGRVDVEVAAEITERIDVGDAVAIMSATAPETAAQILGQVEMSHATDIVSTMAITVDADTAGAIVESADIPVAAAMMTTMVETIDPRVAATIMETGPLAWAASVVEEIEEVTVSARMVDEMKDLARASDILENVSAQKAGGVLDATETRRVVEIVQIMEEEKLNDRLPVMRPEKLFEIPVEVLFNELSTAPTEQLAFEVTPEVDPALALPVATQIGPDSVRYTLPETSAGQWATLVGSPAPINRILAKFNRRVTDLTIDVESLAARPLETPELPSGHVVNSVFSIDMEGVEPEDVSVAHVSLTVEKSWLEANEIHKWSVQFNRFDESLSSWVPFPSKRVREDEERIFYTVSIPGFSLIAVTGSKELPKPLFEVRNLAVNPPWPTADEEFTVSAVVRNKSTEAAVYPATLWINDTVHDSEAILVPGLSMTPITFTVRLDAGHYNVRLERELREVDVVPVGLAPIMVPLPETPAPATAAEDATPEDSQGIGLALLAGLVAAGVALAAIAWIVYLRRASRSH